MANEWDVVSGVGVTALAVADMRACTNSLVEDPYAAEFVNAAGRSFAVQGTVWDYWTRYLAVRTRFYDDYLAASTSQVVLLGAGLDARAYRLTWPADCVLYELDQPEVLRFKQEVLDREGHHTRCVRIPVATDLRSCWPKMLHSKGFDPSQPTTWLAEGLLPYLPADTEHALFRTVHAFSAPGSMIAFDIPPDNSPASMTTSPVFESLMNVLGVHIGTEWLNDPRVDNIDWLRSQNWQVAVDTFEAVAARYGCPLPPDPVVGRGGLVVAHLTTPADRSSTTCIGGTAA